MSLCLSNPYKTEPLGSVLQDLVVRFVINCPSQDLEPPERLFFQLEEAQWFYEDFVRVENPVLPSMKMKSFVERIFQACPILYAYSQDVLGDLSKFQSYKSVIPVRGAIILNKKMTKALMVKGWKPGSSWGFPKGKINKDEQDEHCAVREVYEEIGFDISPYLVPEDYVEVTSREKSIRLYIVRGVSGTTAFEPQTRKEISKIEWHDVKSLPAYSRNSKPSKYKSGEYFMVAPFMSGLAAYIAKVKGVASSLSQSESKALKNLLGVGESANTVNGDIQNAIFSDSDKAAEQLLSLLKGNSFTAASIPPVTNNNIVQPQLIQPSSPSSDRKILLDLLHHGSNQSVESSEERELDNAREILALLRNEISDTQNKIYTSVEPVTSQLNFIHPTRSLNTCDVSVPSSLPHGDHQPMEPQFMSFEKPDYSPPEAPPPPNPILLSLLSTRKPHHRSRPVSDPRFDSTTGGERKPIKLSDLFTDANNTNNANNENTESKPPRSGGSALLSLLGDSTLSGSNPVSMAVAAQPLSPNNQDKISATEKLASNASLDLLGMLKGSNSTPPPISPPHPHESSEQQQQSNALLDLLKGSTSRSNSNSVPSSPNARVDNAAVDNDSSSQSQNHSQSLMDLLRPQSLNRAPVESNQETVTQQGLQDHQGKKEPIQPPPEPQVAPVSSLMDLLHPQPNENNSKNFQQQLSQVDESLTRDGSMSLHSLLNSTNGSVTSAEPSVELGADIKKGDNSDLKSQPVHGVLRLKDGTSRTVEIPQNSKLYGKAGKDDNKQEDKIRVGQKDEITKFDNPIDSKLFKFLEDFSIGAI